MTTVPLFVNGGGMRGGNVHHSIEGLPFLGEASTAPRSADSGFASVARGRGRLPTTRALSGRISVP